MPAGGPPPCKFCVYSKHIIHIYSVYTDIHTHLRIQSHILIPTPVQPLFPTFSTSFDGLERSKFVWSTFYAGVSVFASRMQKKTERSTMMIVDIQKSKYLKDR